MTFGIHLAIFCAQETADGPPTDFGPSFHLDVVVNNAGYSLSGDTESATEEQAHLEMETLFFGTAVSTPPIHPPIYAYISSVLQEPPLPAHSPTHSIPSQRITTRAIANMRIHPTHRGGIIFNISSLAGFYPLPGHAYYHASKFAVEGWSESVAKELHPDWNSSCLLCSSSSLLS